MTVSSDALSIESAATTSPDALSPQPQLRRRPAAIRAWLHRPELGAVAGTAVILLIFFFTADASLFTLAGAMSVLEPAAQLGILAIPAGLLMIAGEFDLSIGSMIAFGGMVVSVPLVLWGWPLGWALLIAFVVACCLGALNATITVYSALGLAFVYRHACLFVYASRVNIGGTKGRYWRCEPASRRAGRYFRRCFLGTLFIW
jgi:simple sugar transport system permease protein